MIDDITLNGPDFYGFTIFCDDIRQEIGGKTSYVGVYTGNIRVHTDFPVVLPKFGLGVSYIQRRENFIKPTKFLIFLPGDGEQPSVEFALTDRSLPDPEKVSKEIKDNPQAVAATNAVIILSPLQINGPGWIRVRAEREGKLVRLGAIEVVRAPKDNAASAA